MAGAKEIRTQIASVKNTQKITSAMEMVAAAKMRKSQDRMHASRPYAQKMRSVIGHLAHSHAEYKHEFMQSREVKKIGYIVISSDRGLCGGLNNNLFRKVLREVAELKNKGIEVDFCTVGNKALGFFNRISDCSLIAQATQLGDKPSLDDLVGVVKIMLDAYSAGDVDEIRLAFNGFVNTMTQEPTIDQLVPLPDCAEEEKAEMSDHWDYIYEPDAKDVLIDLLTRYIESLVYQGVVENGACEQSARMVAMKSASDNATDLIDELELIYNKARQAAITQEISEIVSGAAAV